MRLGEAEAGLESVVVQEERVGLRGERDVDSRWDDSRAVQLDWFADVDEDDWTVGWRVRCC